MRFLRTAILALGMALLVAQPAAASVISDGSSGVFRPTADFTLDLSGTAFPQYSSIFIDAGVRLTVLAPTGGVFGGLLAANDIFVNGIIDAGTGNLGLLAGNQILLGAGSQLTAGSLNLSATSVLNSGAISVIGGTLNAGTRSGSIWSPGGSTQSGGTISIGSGSDSIGTLLPSPTVLTGEIQGGTISIGGSSGLIFNSPTVPIFDPIVIQNPDVTFIGVLNPIPEPSAILLLLPGLALLARKSIQRECAV